MKHLHFLGISGTFMSALALIARQSGYTVTGSDTACYPPISDLLLEKGIVWVEGYENNEALLNADCVIVGNAMKRGVPAVEVMLDTKKAYTSGPQWLADNILPAYQVIAIAGTHGKTTTTSMLAWILEYAGCDPSFLIGGIAQNFNTNARLGQGKWFVIEADEYDTAFFDKRPKFMHYRPQVALINNLEFDHADIYADLAAIQRQIHFLLRTIPSRGFVVKPKHDLALNEVLKDGKFSQLIEWSINSPADFRGNYFDETLEIEHEGVKAPIHWNLLGKFNLENALSAVCAAHCAGVDLSLSCEALSYFKPPKRRLEERARVNGVAVFDDFAHHPTAISKTIEALKESKRYERIIVILEFASYTMKSGVHASSIGKALKEADYCIFLKPEHFSLLEIKENWLFPYEIKETTDQILEAVLRVVKPQDAVLIMSNRGFDNIHSKLVQAL